MKQDYLHNSSLHIAIIGSRSKTAEAIVRILQAETTWKLTLFSSGTKQVKHDDRLSFYPIIYDDSKKNKEIFLKILPDIIINTAALTNVDFCEENREQTWQINVRWVEFLLHICKITDAQLIHFSTDYVFDGNKGPYMETDAPNPVNYYGKSKLAGENICKVSNINCSIIRTNVVYGFSSYRHSDFVQWVLAKLRENKSFQVVTDQYSNPTLADDLGLAVYKIIQKHRQGIYHIGGGEWLNRYEFARKIAMTYNYDPECISACTTADIRQKARRPMRGGLITLKAETDLGIKPAAPEAGLLTLRRQFQMLDLSSEYDK